MKGGFGQDCSSFVFLITKLAKEKIKIKKKFKKIKKKRNWQRTAMSIPYATLVLRIAGLPLIPFRRVIFLVQLDIVWSDSLLTSLSQKTHQNVTRDGFS